MSQVVRAVVRHCLARLRSLDATTRATASHPAATYAAASKHVGGAPLVERFDARGAIETLAETATWKAPVSGATAMALRRSSTTLMRSPPTQPSRTKKSDSQKPSRTLAATFVMKAQLVPPRGEMSAARPPGRRVYASAASKGSGDISFLQLTPNGSSATTTSMEQASSSKQISARLHRTSTDEPGANNPIALAAATFLRAAAQAFSFASEEIECTSRIRVAASMAIVPTPPEQSRSNSPGWTPANSKSKSAVEKRMCLWSATFHARRSTGNCDDLVAPSRMSPSLAHESPKEIASPCNTPKISTSYCFMLAGHESASTTAPPMARMTSSDPKQCLPSRTMDTRKRGAAVLAPNAVSRSALRRDSPRPSAQTTTSGSASPTPSGTPAAAATKA
mmetsp:Transcript_5565/g.13913  ORF Transcript_5565/g.13913 Transcript_5565/m.13913 type:complete len:393 (-) Transcript_5565:125-1303(-)